MKPFDVAPFALPNTPPGEIRFEEPRDVREVVATFRGRAPRRVRLRYLARTWPASRWEAGRDTENPFAFGWSPRDDQFNGTWREARCRSVGSGRRVRVTFRGLASELGREAAGHDVTFRRTLGVRVEAPGAPIERLEVYTRSRPAETALRVELDAGRRTRGRAVRFSAYNAVVARVRGGPGVRAGRRGVVLGRGRRSFGLAVRHLRPAHRYSGDGGHVTFHLDHDAFTIGLDALERLGPVWYAEEGVYVARADDPGSFAAYRARCAGSRTVLGRVRRRPEHSLQAALLGQPRPHADATSLGWKHRRQKFWLEPNADLVLHRMNVARIPGRDTPAFRNRGNGRFFFGLEAWSPAGRFCDPAPASAYNVHLRRGGLKLEVKALAVPLRGERPDDPVAALMRFSFANEGDAVETAELRVAYSDDSSRTFNVFDGRAGERDEFLVPRSPRERLGLRGRELRGGPGGRVLRARCETAMRGAARKGAAVFSKRLAPGSRCEAVLKIPYVDLDAADRGRLASLRFEEARRRAARAWAEEHARGASLATPDPALDAVHASHLTHVLVTDSGMPDDPDLVNTSVGTSTYGNFSNESCMIVQELDQRGLHEEARRRLDLWIAYQGTAPQPGNFTDHRGMYFGAGGFEDGAYNQHHGWVLWAMAEHYFLSRDARWFARASASVVAGADWVFRQRRTTAGPAMPHSRGFERGFLPAGSLEDVTDFHYWLSTNCLTWRGCDHAARALEVSGHPEAARVRREADAYRDDLKRGFEAMRRVAPLARLRDGRWVPRYPCRLYARERDFGWIREVLEGPVYLLISGLYDARSREGRWILEDYQDNLYMTPPYGYPVSDPERHEPARGGFSMQPNLLAGALPHLDRDEPEIFLWMLFNGFASCYREEIEALIEHPSPELGFSNAAHFKTSDEANAVMWTRYALVWTGRGELHLGRAIPRAWLRDGREASLSRVVTPFGPVSVRYRSAAGRGLIRCEAALAAAARDASRVRVRFRHPDGKRIARVRVNGRPWRRVDAARGDVDLTGMSGRVLVEARYRARPG